MTAFRSSTPIVDLARYRHAIVADEEGVEHAAIVTRSGVVRLDVVAGSISQGPVDLRVHVDCNQAVGFKLAAFDRLLRAVDINDPGRRPQPADPRLARLIEGLRVVDALADGASLQEIATGLWAPGNDERADVYEEHIKSKARRRVDLARRLLSAGPSAVMALRV